MCQLTSAVPLPGLAVTFCGAVDAEAGVAGVCDGCEAAESPLMLVAITVKVYDVPLVSPMTVHDVEPEVVQVLKSGEEVTV